MDPTLIQNIAVYAIPVLFAITLHEAAHGYVAKHFGDDTAYVMGRISINPNFHTACSRFDRVVTSSRLACIRNKVSKTNQLQAMISRKTCP